MTKGRFIVFEGIDGAGTTTQARKLTESLFHRDTSRPPLFTWEPTDSPIGGLLRSYSRGLKENLPDWRTMSLLFAADRQNHWDSVIFPYLQSGCDVICDRYTWSTLAYQSSLSAECLSGRDWDLCVGESIFEISRFSTLVEEPDLTIYLDISVEEAQRRISERGKPGELYEDLEYQKKVKVVYQRLCKAFRYPLHKVIVIDGSLSEEEVASRCLEVVERIKVR